MEPLLDQQIQKIYIDSSALNSSLAQRAQNLFPNKIEIVDSKPLSYKDGALSAEDFDRSKRLIYIAPYKGSFFKRCPGAKPGLTCCNYFVLNLGLQCNMNCSYCYLQSYINSPVMTLYSNIEQALAEIQHLATLYPDQNYRVGTGETTDSLSLDELTLFSRTLISFFKQIPTWKLEFKTKSSKVDQFLDVDHGGNVICSWSVNPQFIVEREEHLTASLKDRLAAAKKCLDKGYTVAFHIDPMIWHLDWKKNYKTLVDEITSKFAAQEITYVTVGALRFQPEQRHIMRERFGLSSHVTQAEMFVGRDGKMRYDLNLRNEMFDFLKNEFKSRDPRWRISLCMEVPESWSLTMASSPRKVPELTELF